MEINVLRIVERVVSQTRESLRSTTSRLVVEKVDQLFILNKYGNNYENNNNRYIGFRLLNLNNSETEA